MYRQLYPHSKSDKFFSRIFTIFDRNRDDLRAIKITINGNLQDKLKCAFQIYDLKGDGKLDRHEMKKILKYIYNMLGEDSRRTRRNSKAVQRKVDLIFKEFDLDRDNFLSLDEFINGCENDEYLNHLLNATFQFKEPNVNNIELLASIDEEVASSNGGNLSSNAEEFSSFYSSKNQAKISNSIANTTSNTCTSQEENVSYL